MSMSQEEDVEMRPREDGDDEMNEEDAIAKAIEMSMKGPEGEGGGSNS